MELKGFRLIGNRIQFAVLGHHIEEGIADIEDGTGPGNMDQDLDIHYWDLQTADLEDWIPSTIYHIYLMI